MPMLDPCHYMYVCILYAVLIAGELLIVTTSTKHNTAVIRNKHRGVGR
jgi:hypothetical protein